MAARREIQSWSGDLSVTIRTYRMRAAYRADLGFGSHLDSEDRHDQVRLLLRPRAMAARATRAPRGARRAGGVRHGCGVRALPPVGRRPVRCRLRILHHRSNGQCHEQPRVRHRSDDAAVAFPSRSRRPGVGHARSPLGWSFQSRRRDRREHQRRPLGIRVPPVRRAGGTDGRTPVFAVGITRARKGKEVWS